MPYPEIILARTKKIGVELVTFELPIQMLQRPASQQMAADRGATRPDPVARPVHHHHHHCRDCRAAPAPTRRASPSACRAGRYAPTPTPTRRRRTPHLPAESTPPLPPPLADRHTRRRRRSAEFPSPSSPAASRRPPRDSRPRPRSRNGGASALTLGNLSFLRFLPGGAASPCRARLCWCARGRSGRWTGRLSSSGLACVRACVPKVRVGAYGRLPDLVQGHGKQATETIHCEFLPDSVCYPQDI
jgi:hypothetical protein